MSTTYQLPHRRPHRTPPRIAPDVRLSLAGLAGIAMSYGFARYGYGLFLPEIRAEFSLSVSQVGMIGSATYVGYLAALVVVGALVAKVGARALVAAGGVSATIGTALVAVAPSVGVLSIGLILAGTSPGWIWASYSDAAHRMLPAARRERVLAVIPSGTAFGVVVAGPLALVLNGPTWKVAWLIFAMLSAVATIINLRALPPRAPGRPGSHESEAMPRVTVRWFARRATGRVYATALSYGVVGSAYWLLAVEAVTSAAGTGPQTAAMFWTLTGAAGLAGVFAGVAITKLGLANTHGLLFAAISIAVALLAVAPGHLMAIVLSAVLYGPTFMAVSAVLAVWSYDVFPQRPATGLSAVAFFLGIGTIIGPVAIGALADSHDMRTAFLVVAAIAGVTVFMRPAGRHAL